MQTDADPFLALGDGREADRLDVQAGPDQFLTKRIDLGIAVHDNSLDGGGRRQEHMFWDLDVGSEVFDQLLDFVYQLQKKKGSRIFFCPISKRGWLVWKSDKANRRSVISPECMQGWTPLLFVDICDLVTSTVSPAINIS